MAYNMRCKNCGRKESTHEITVDDDGPSRRLPGRKFSLENCPDFELSKQDIKNLKIIKKEEEVVEIAKGEHLYQRQKGEEGIIKVLGRYFK